MQHEFYSGCDKLSYDDLFDWTCEAADAYAELIIDPDLTSDTVYQILEEKFLEMSEGMEADGKDILAVGLFHYLQILHYKPEIRRQHVLKVVE